MVEAATFGGFGTFARSRRRPVGLGRMVTVLVLSASVTLGGGAVAVAQAPAGEGVPQPPTPAAPATPPPPGVVVPAPEAVPSEPVPPPWEQAPAAMPPPVPMGAPEMGAGASAPSHLPAILMWAVGGASLAVGAAFGIAAISAKNDFDSKPTYGLADKVHDRAVISDVGFGLGLVLVATGTVFYFSDAGSSAEPKVAAATGGVGSNVGRFRFAPLIGSTSGGGVVTMRF